MVLLQYVHQVPIIKITILYDICFFFFVRKIPRTKNKMGTKNTNKYNKMNSRDRQKSNAQPRCGSPWWATTNRKMSGNPWWATTNKKHNQTSVNRCCGKACGKTCLWKLHFAGYSILQTTVNYISQDIVFLKLQPDCCSHNAHKGGTREPTGRPRGASSQEAATALGS